MDEFKKRIEWVKKCPVEAAELIEKQKNEFITMSQSVEECDTIIGQLQVELKQYKLQETLLIEKLKKQDEKIKELKLNSKCAKYYEMAKENLRISAENAQLKGIRNVVH